MKISEVEKLTQQLEVAAQALREIKAIAEINPAGSLPSDMMVMIVKIALVRILSLEADFQINGDKSPQTGSETTQTRCP